LRPAVCNPASARMLSRIACFRVGGHTGRKPTLIQASGLSVIARARHGCCALLSNCCKKAPNRSSDPRVRGPALPATMHKTVKTAAAMYAAGQRYLCWRRCNSRNSKVCTMIDAVLTSRRRSRWSCRLQLTPMTVRPIIDWAVSRATRLSSCSR